MLDSNVCSICALVCISRASPDHHTFHYPLSTCTKPLAVAMEACEGFPIADHQDMLPLACRLESWTTAMPPLGRLISYGRKISGKTAKPVTQEALAVTQSVSLTRHDPALACVVDRIYAAHNAPR